MTSEGMTRDQAIRAAALQAACTISAANIIAGHVRPGPAAGGGQQTLELADIMADWIKAGNKDDIVEEAP